MSQFPFLPTTQNEIRQKGWTSVDIILITGDAYIDHPSFGAAIIGRYLESFGFKVGIIPQPDWQTDTDFLALGKPNLCFGVTAGNLDSMIANYTAEKKPRNKDDYSENGEPQNRPDQAILVYCNKIKQLFPNIPIIIGGIEASLRRISYYDYWSNRVRRSILLDSRADLLVYGMGEKAILSAVEHLQNNKPLVGIPNTAYLATKLPTTTHTLETNIQTDHSPYILLDSHETVSSDKLAFLKTTLLHERECAKKHPRRIIQACQNRYIVIEPPESLSSTELDTVYRLPFMRKAHPRYKKSIPGFRFVQDSVVSHRGCYGGCSFCTLTVHQGKHIVSRSEDAILEEVTNCIITQPDFKGHILDVGGPSANMYKSQCIHPQDCARLSCLVPSICRFLKPQQHAHLALLQKINQLPAIKKVFVNSGIRFDLALKDPQYIKGITQSHVSGQLSLAPEHTQPAILKLMQKPGFELYESFLKIFQKANQENHLKQFVVPYFIASHPGCTLQDMFELSLYLRKNNLRIEQVQNFIPIPMTLSAAMYYTELDPFTLKPLHVAKGEERFFQRALLQPTLPANAIYLKKALKRIGKEKFEKYLTTFSFVAK